jgi:hypothetical protein
MLKKIVFGNSDGYIVDEYIKTKVIDYIYSNLNLSNHRYIMLNTIQKLKYLQDNEHYVSPNFKGYNYLMIMLTIDGSHICVVIDRKKLSYHKEQLDMKTIQIIQINMIFSKIIYSGTILDGKLIQTNNEYIYLIQDCFYLMGKHMFKMEMMQKMNYLDTILKTHFIKNTNEITNGDYQHSYSTKNQNNSSYRTNFNFKLNKLYKYNELENLINSLSKLHINTNGIIFYPKYSGITNIHIEKKVEKVDINTNNKEIIEQKSYHIIHDFVNFLKSRTYSYESNNKMKILWLNRTSIPDVYDIAEVENGEKQGIALIPNLKISQMCDELIGDKSIKFNCIFCNRFKKWIPLNVV